MRLERSVNSEFRFATTAMKNTWRKMNMNKITITTQELERAMSSVKKL